MERDLRIAISEYASESEVVAGGFKWRSYALKLVPNHAWPRHDYGTCKDCGFYIRRLAETGAAIPGDCPTCGGTMRKGTFIEPRFGFQTAWEEPDRPDESRPDRTYSSRVFFTGEMSAAGPTTRIVGSGLTLEGRPARHGRLAVINRAAKGARFRICEKCGCANLFDDENLPLHAAVQDSIHATHCFAATSTTSSRTARSSPWTKGGSSRMVEAFVTWCH